MDDLISKQALKEDLLKRGFFPVIVKCALEAAPAVDAVPVKHRQWDRRRAFSTDVICSGCGTLQTTKDSQYKSRFCPNCGAKMDGERKENETCKL